VTISHSLPNDGQGRLSKQLGVFQATMVGLRSRHGSRQTRTKGSARHFSLRYGQGSLQIFLNLKLTTEEQQDIHECIKALEAYLKPKRNVAYERHLFNMCQQNSGETVDSYVNRL